MDTVSSYLNHPFDADWKKVPANPTELHNSREPSVTALGHLGIPPATAENVMKMVTAWAQNERHQESEGFEHILRRIQRASHDTCFLEELRRSIKYVLCEEHRFGGNVESICWSGTDTFGNLRLSQCVGKRALSTLIRPATVEWAKWQWAWPTIDPESRLAILLLLFYAGSERAVALLRYFGHLYPTASYTEMRERQLQSDTWIIKRPPFFNLVGPEPGGGIEIHPTLLMGATVLIVRDIAIPIAVIIGMIATISNTKAWGKEVGFPLAIVSAGISFCTILLRTLWGKIFPGTLEHWRVYGPTRITDLSKCFFIGPGTLQKYKEASIAATFSGSVKRTAIGPKSSWAPDDGQPVFYSTKPLDLTVLTDFGLVRGTDKVLGGHIMLRNVYGRTTGVKVEVVEEYQPGYFHSYHMPSSGQINIGRTIKGSIT